MRGILLAGGTGSRLYPLTKCINKHLLPICGKPMAQWNIEKFVDAGIKDILIVSGQEQCGSIIQQFGDGSELNCNLTYKVQTKAGGIAQALGLAKDFVRDEPMCVILGDNIFSMSLKDEVRNFRDGARIFLKKVPDPSRYGVASVHRKISLTTKNQIIVDSIEEKPKEPKSEFAVTGIYFYDSRVFDIIADIKPSARGELEITDVNNYYIAMNEMTAFIMDDDEFWSDAGTFASYDYVNKEFHEREETI